MPNWLGDLVHTLPALARLAAGNARGRTAVLLPEAHARIVRMAEPVREHHADMIGGKAPQVAERIAAILKERLS